MGVISRVVSAVAVSLTLLSVQSLFNQADAAVMVQGPATSHNWSGYAVVLSTFHDVSASWTQPAVTCSAADDQAASWVGLDGDGSDTVEQTGTMAKCENGVPTYAGWYEMYPQDPDDVFYADSVYPGDHFSADVSTDGTGTFVMTLQDVTRHWTERTIKVSQASATGQSAEVIEEQPTDPEMNPFPLADFGTVTFTDVLVDRQPLTVLDPWQINMINDDGSPQATTSLPTPGSGFSVKWQHS